MAILANDGRWALETTSPYTYKVNNTNLGSQTTVTGVADSLYSNWAGVYGSQLNLPYNSINSNSYLNLYARHMGGWATVDLGTDAADRYDTVALNRTGDWVLNFQGGDKLIAGASVAVSPSATAYIAVNAYVTSNASFNTDGSLKLVAATSGSQNVTFESGLTGNQYWDRIKNNPGAGQWWSPGVTDDWSVTGAVMGTYSTTRHNNNEQSDTNIGVGLTENAAGDVNQTSTVTLGDGADNLLFLNNTRTVTDYWWQSFWIFGGRWNSYTYVENAWTIYRDGGAWKAYNNFKDYTVTISSDVETIYYSFVNDDGSVDYQVFKNDGGIDHYSNGFPPLSGSGGSSPTPNSNPINPLNLGDSGFVPSTDTASSGSNTANIQVVAPKGATVSFYSSADHNEGDTTAGLRTFTTHGVQTLSFAARDTGNDPAAAELGNIKITLGSSYGLSQYKLFLGTNAAGGDTLTAPSARVLAYGFNGNDNLTGSAFNDTLVGGEGNDTMQGGAGRDSLYGGADNDSLNGGNDNDYIEGGAGNDYLIGSGDAVTSGAGYAGNTIVDTLLGGEGSDTIVGGVGDFVQGGAGSDRLEAADTGTTYFVDNEGNNNVITNAHFDAVYFSASNKGNYTNTIFNGGLEVVTLLVEHGSTTRSASDTEFTSADTPTSAFVYVPDSQNLFVSATSAGNADVINFYGGDRYDVGYWDKTVNTVLFGTWYQWRNFYTIDGRTASSGNFDTLDQEAEVLDWASDGDIYYGTPSGNLAPGDPDGGYRVTSAAGIIVTAGYKGYFTFYNSRVNTSAIYYVDAGAGNTLVSDAQMTYLGMMNGQAGASVKYGSFVNGQFSLGDTPVPEVLPLPIVDGIDLAEVDDTFVSGLDYNDDDITMTDKGLTLTARVVNGVTAADMAIYEWVDSDSDGNVDAGETTKLTVSSADVWAWVDSDNDGIIDQDDLNGTNVGSNELKAVGSVPANTVTAFVYKGNIDLADGDHKILMTQTSGKQTSDLDAGSALTISVRTDFVPPEFTTLTAVAVNDASGQLTVTADDNIKSANYLKLQMVKVSDGTVLGGSVDATAQVAATLAVSEQASVWSGVVKTTDDAGNSALSDVNIALGTKDGETLNAKGAFNAVYGFGGNDSITSQEGKDSLFGGAGDDVINSGTGDDLVDGGSGADTFVITGTSSESTIQFNRSFSDAAGTFDLTDGSFNNFSRSPSHTNSTEYGGWLPTEWSLYVGAGSPTNFTVDFVSNPYIHIVGSNLSNQFMRIDGSLSSTPMTFANVTAFQDYVTSAINNIRYGSMTAATAITWSYNATTGIVKASVGETGLVYDNTGSWNAFDHSYRLVTTGGASTLSLTSADTIIGGTDTDALDISSVTGAIVTDVMFTNVSSVETLKLGGGNDSVTLSTYAGAAGIANVSADTGDDVIDITTLTLTGDMTLGAGSNKVKMANGSGLSGTVTAAGGTSTLELASNAKVSLTAAAYNLFNATGITAAGNEQITLSDALTGAAVLNANVETFVMAAAATNSVTSGKAAQTINANALTDGQALTLTGTHNVTVSLVAGDLTSTSTGNITVTATSGSNVITTGAGADVISAGDGDDYIDGGTGADSLSGGLGNDTLLSQNAATTLEGGDGNDTYNIYNAGLVSDSAGTADKAVIYWGYTPATDAAFDGVELIEVWGGTTSNFSQQSEGFTITMTGAATVAGGAGADSITGSGGNDTINGFVGQDTVAGGAGLTDSIVLTATSSDLNNAVDAQISTVEIVTASTATAAVTIDLSAQSEGFAIVGSGQNDDIKGTSAADSITGGNGSDTIRGFAGADTIDGSGGSDTLVLTATSTDLNNALDTQLVSVENVTAAGAAAGVSIDLHLQTEAINVTGSSHDDTITGGDGADTITGGAAADQITGGAGADTIDVGATDNAADLVVYTASGQTQTGLFTDGGSTASMDVISNMELGDKLKLWNVFSGAVTPVTTFLTTVTADQAAIVRGSWNGTNFSQGNTVSDDDYVVQWADGTQVHSVILKDYGTMASGLTVDVAADTLTVSQNTSPVLTLPSAFANQVQYGTGSLARWVTSADVNGDLAPDLIVANTGAGGQRYGGTVSVLINKNDGSGTFNSAQNTGVGEELLAVSAMDVNNDTFVDLVVTDYAWDTVTVLKNDGSGNFPSLDSPPYLTGNGNIQSSSPNNGGPTSISTGDVTGDGKLDLVVANQISNTLAVLVNKGDGTFAPMVEYATGNSPWYSTIADVDGDNDLDLVVANSGNSTVSVLTNKGDGTFNAKVDYATGSNSQSVTTADVNGDGKADLLVSNRSSHTVSVLINKGDGTFNAKVDYATGNQPLTVSSADINGDGALDMLVTNTGSNTVSVLTNKGDGTFNAKTDINLANSPWHINTADVNGDGAADLLVTSWSGTVSVLLNTSTAVFTEGTPVLINSGLTLSDADGDADWNGGSLTVDITANNTADDRMVLPVTNPGGSAIWLDTSASNALMSGSTVIGSADAAEAVNGATWTFTFNASATNTLVQSLARSIKFDNLSDVPNTATRTITLTATDKGGLSASVDKDLKVIAVTDNETITGTAFADTLISDAGNDALIGGAGNDSLLGYNGSDTLTGGAGVDTLTGGLGSDLFSLSGVSAAADRDEISDFVLGVDTVGLDADYTTAATPAGSAAVFASHTFNASNVGNTAADYLLGDISGLDVLVFPDLAQGLGDLDAATDGTELLKMFYTTGPVSVGSLEATASVSTYLVAYDNGKNYLYLANSADKWVQNHEITLVGTFNGVTFTAADFVVVS